MEITKKTSSQVSKPTGIIGKIPGHLMNILQTGFYKKYLEKLSLKDNICILDIGCGGRKVIQFLAEKIIGRGSYNHPPEKRACTMTSKKRPVPVL